MHGTRRRSREGSRSRGARNPGNRERVIPLSYEKLMEQPVATLNEVLERLDVAPVASVQSSERRIRSAADLALADEFERTYASEHGTAPIRHYRPDWS